ncbi:MAG: hypothetical protein NTU88_08710, partial [Armatimonadetes bacterium]|nr:hypothetical protein [Armatimonadota bacterium]
MFGRSSINRLRRTAAVGMTRRLVSVGRFIVGLRPVRWAARQRVLRIPVGIFILLYAVFGRFIWRPGTRFIKRIRRYLGRHEVWFYLFTWAICALIGLTLSITWWLFNTKLISMLLAAVAAGGFALICFR